MRKPRQTPPRTTKNKKNTPQEGESRLGSVYDKIIKENLEISLLKQLVRKSPPVYKNYQKQTVKKKNFIRSCAFYQIFVNCNQ